VISVVVTSMIVMMYMCLFVAGIVYVAMYVASM
jgi:hypothetical protein